LLKHFGIYESTSVKRLLIFENRCSTMEFADQEGKNPPHPELEQNRSGQDIYRSAHTNYGGNEIEHEPTRQEEGVTTKIIKAVTGTLSAGAEMLHLKKREEPQESHFDQRRDNNEITHEGLGADRSNLDREDEQLRNARNFRDGNVIGRESFTNEQGYREHPDERLHQRNLSGERAIPTENVSFQETRDRGNRHDEIATGHLSDKSPLNTGAVHPEDYRDVQGRENLPLDQGHRRDNEHHGKPASHHIPAASAPGTGQGTHNLAQPESHRNVHGTGTQSMEHRHRRDQQLR